VVFGVNPLFIFALSGLWAKAMGRLVHFTDPDGKIISANAKLYRDFFLPMAGELNGSLLFAISHVVFFWMIGYVLYKKKIFIKV